MICSSVCGDKSAKSSSIVAKAVISIIENYFVKGYPQVDLLSVRPWREILLSEVFASKILRIKKDKVKRRVCS